MCLIALGIVDVKNNIARMDRMSLGCPELILKQIEEVTRDSVVIMDYAKYLSFRNTRLPGRNTIVLFEGNPAHLHGTICVTNDAEDIIRLAKTKRVVIFGDGDEIYRMFLDRPEMTTIYIANLSARIESVSTFPIISTDDWAMRRRTLHGIDDKNKYPLVFEMWIRTQPVQESATQPQGGK